MEAEAPMSVRREREFSTISNRKHLVYSSSRFGDETIIIRFQSQLMRWFKCKGKRAKADKYCQIYAGIPKF